LGIVGVKNSSSDLFKIHLTKIETPAEKVSEPKVSEPNNLKTASEVPLPPSRTPSPVENSGSLENDDDNAEDKIGFYSLIKKWNSEYAKDTKDFSALENL
jgi:hypothetical protein